MNTKIGTFMRDLCNYQPNNNIFTVLPMEQLKFQYLSNIANLLPFVLESFNLNVSDINTIHDIYHWKSDLCYATGKYLVELGPLPLSKVPNDIQKLVSLPENAENKIRNFLRKQNIRPWAEIEKEIKGSKNWLSVKDKLQTSLLLDFIYELIASNKNKKLFGKISTLDILNLLKETVPDINFIPKLSPYNNYFDCSKYSDPYRYYYNLQKETDKDGNKTEKINVTDDNLRLYPLTKGSVTRTEILLNYYYQLAEPYLNKNHKLHKYYAEQAQYTKSSQAKEFLKNTINTEYALLYQQLPYLYTANWLNEIEPTSSNFLASFWSIEIIDDNNAAKVTSKLKDLSLTKDITTNINPSYVYKANNKNFSYTKKCIYQLYYFAYLSQTITDMRNTFESYYNDMNQRKNITMNISRNIIFNIFRFGYLLRHSIFFRAKHSELLAKLGFDREQISIEAPAISTPSYFSSTFLNLLSQQHSPNSDIELLKNESEKYTHLITEPVKKFSEYNNDIILEALNKALSTIYSIDSYKPKNSTALIDIIQEDLISFLYIDTTTKEWKKLNELLTDYYKANEPKK